MKILSVDPGKSYSGPEFLVEMTANELARIIGYDYFNTMDPATRGGLQRGTVVQVEEGWNLLQKVRQSAERLRTVRETLRGVVDVLGPLPQLIFPVLEGQDDLAGNAGTQVAP